VFAEALRAKATNGNSGYHLVRKMGIRDRCCCHKLAAATVERVEWPTANGLPNSWNPHTEIAVNRLRSTPDLSGGKQPKPLAAVNSTASRIRRSMPTMPDRSQYVLACKDD